MLVQLLPDVVWGAVLGSLITFLGVSLQLRHARREREKERNHALKKETLIRVAEAIAGVYTFLAEFGRPDIPPQQHGESLRGLAGWLDRVHLVGDTKTIEALTAATDYLVKASATLSLQRLDVQNLEADLKAKEAERDRLQEEQSNLGNALRRLASDSSAGSPQTTQQALNLYTLETIIEGNRSSLAQLAGEIQVIGDKYRSAQLELFRVGVEHSIEFQKLCIPAKVELRRELGVPDAALQRVLSASFDARLPEMAVFLAELRRRAAIPAPPPKGPAAADAAAVVSSSPDPTAPDARG